MDTDGTREVYLYGIWNIASNSRCHASRETSNERSKSYSYIIVISNRPAALLLMAHNVYLNIPFLLSHPSTPFPQPLILLFLPHSLVSSAAVESVDGSEWGSGGIGGGMEANDVSGWGAMRETGK